MRSMEMSAKTVEAAVQAACEALGVDRDDINVSYEVLEFPTRKLFKTIPAKVLVKVEEPEAAPAPAAEEKPAEVSTKPAEFVEISDETAPEIEKAVVEDMVEAAELAPVAEDDVEIPLDIAAAPRLQAAVDYLTPIFNLMGVENFSFTAVKKGAATILKVSGEHMGALIGRRGETMESLSYLASLVVNRMEGPYIKLGLDVGGYRNKRGGRRDGGRDPRRDGNRGYRGNGPRGPRSGRDGRDGGRGGYRGNRGDRGPRYGGPRSSVPARDFADRPRDPDAKPMAPKTTERIHDGDDFAFGKIEF